MGDEVFVRPAEGEFTSGFGARWGVVHYGVDIANAIGTPIYAYSDGVVEDAGPASGFGLWVVLRHPDGTHTVYGHVNRMFVKVGEKVARASRSPRSATAASRRGRTCTSRSGPRTAPRSTRCRGSPRTGSRWVRASASARRR